MQHNHIQKQTILASLIIFVYFQIKQEVISGKIIINYISVMVCHSYSFFFVFKAFCVPNAFQQRFKHFKRFKAFQSVSKRFDAFQTIYQRFIPFSYIFCCFDVFHSLLQLPFSRAHHSFTGVPQRFFCFYDLLYVFQHFERIKKHFERKLTVFITNKRKAIFIKTLKTPINASERHDTSQYAQNDIERL